MRDELLNRAVAGDHAAVEAVIAFIRPLVERYCRARLGRDRSGLLVDDVVQEVCLAVFTALPTYRTRGRPFLAFVYGVTAHKVTDALRGAIHDRSVSVADVPDRVDIGDEPHMRDELTRMLGTLPKAQREVLVLRIVVGLSAEETAEVVGSTPGAVRVAQYRALARLRAERTREGSTAPDFVDLLTEPGEAHLRRDYQVYVTALASALDLDAGLAHLEDRHGHRDFVAGLAGQLNLDAGLDALLRSTEAERP
nr:RNA polymerase sigma factor ShbA [Pseudonocardia sp. MH-G8]